MNWLRSMADEVLEDGPDEEIVEEEKPAQRNPEPPLSLQPQTVVEGNSSQYISPVGDNAKLPETKVKVEPLVEKQNVAEEKTAEPEAKDLGSVVEKTGQIEKAKELTMIYRVCTNAGEENGDGKTKNACDAYGLQIPMKKDANYCFRCGHETKVVRATSENVVNVVVKRETPSELENSANATSTMRSWSYPTSLDPLALIRSGKYEYPRSRRAYMDEFVKRMREALKDKFEDKEIYFGICPDGLRRVKTETIKKKKLFGGEKEVTKTKELFLVNFDWDYIAETTRKVYIKVESIATIAERVFAEMERESDFAGVFKSPLEIKYDF